MIEDELINVLNHYHCISEYCKAVDVTTLKGIQWDHHVIIIFRYLQLKFILMTVSMN